MREPLLVVGAGGRVGRAVVSELDRQGVPVLTAARGPGQHTAVGPCRHRAAGDLRDDTYVDRLCELARGATVIYCAQVGGRVAARADPAAAFRVNATVPGRLAAVADRMIHLSSDYVFGTPGPAGEADSPRPVDDYSTSKADGERAVLRAGRRVTVVRTSGVYDRDEGHWGRFAALTRIRASDSRCSSPTYLPDLVDALLSPDLAAGIVHAVGPDVLSAYEFAQVASLRWGFDVQPCATDPRTGIDMRPSRGVRVRAAADVLVPEHRAGVRDAPVTVLDTVGVVLAGRRHLERDPRFWADQAAATSMVRYDLARTVAAYGPNPVVWRFLRCLSSDAVHVLANNGPRASFERWVERYGLHRIFALTINSERDGLTKPSAGFRDRIQALAGGHRVRLVDDRADIVAAAESWGWEGVISRRTRRWPVEHFTPRTPLQ